MDAYPLEDGYLVVTAGKSAAAPRITGINTARPIDEDDVTYTLALHLEIQPTDLSPVKIKDGAGLLSPLNYYLRNVGI